MTTHRPCNRFLDVRILILAAAVFAVGMPSRADGPDRNATLERGRDLLAAIRAGNTAEVDRLSGFVDLTQHYGQYYGGDDAWETPPMVAVDAGDLEVLTLLIAHGASVDSYFVRDIDGSPTVTVAAFALQKGRREIAKYLVSHGADAWHPLWVAVNNDDTDFFNFGLSYLKDPNERYPGGWTLLMLNSLNGRVDFTLALIKKGADVNIQSYDWMTDRSASDESGKDSALSAAVKGRYPDVVAILLAAGAKPTQIELDAALYMQEPTLAEDFLERGATPGDVSLVFACEAGYDVLVEKILGMGVSPNAEYRGRKALDAAEATGNTRLVELLMSAGADP